MVLNAITNLLRYSRFPGERFPGSPEISIRDDRNDVSLSLPPHEGVERSVADGLCRVLSGRKKPAVLVRLDRIEQFGGKRGDRYRVGLAILGLGPVDDALG